MHVSFGSFQVAILVAFIVISLVLFEIFLTVAQQSRCNVAYETVADTGYRLRRYWFGFLVVLLGSAIILSLVFMPTHAQGGTRTEVKVTGYQFNWTVEPTQVTAGTDVAFNVTSSDVNHGLGVYDPKGRLMGTVQAMPGYRNILNLTLNTPGEYTFACLEFCGVSHHVMIRKFTVTP